MPGLCFCSAGIRFGALLTELRELNQKMTADGELIFQVENEAMFSGCSDARAYSG
jgi:hypothetical protein